MDRQPDMAGAPRAAPAWRRRTANAVVCALLLTAVAVLWAPRWLNVAGKLSTPALLAPAAEKVRATLVRSLKMLRMQAAEAGGAVEVVAPDGQTCVFAGDLDAGAFRDGFLLAWAAAVLGAFLAAATWDLGWVRRVVLLAGGLVLAPVLLVVFAGAFQAVAMAAVSVRAEDILWAGALAGRAGLFAALAATAMAWWAVQSVVTDEPDEAPPAATAPAVSAPPLLWACAVAAPVLAVAAALDAAGIAREVHDAFYPPPVPAALAVAGLAGGAVLLAATLWRSKRLRPWAPLPLLLAAPAGAAAGLLFLAAALAVHDERCRAHCGRPVDEAAARRIRRRAARPLTGVALTLGITAILGAAALTAKGFWDADLPVLLAVADPWLILPLALAGAALAAWDWSAIRRAGQAGLARAPIAAGLLGLAAAALGGVAAWATVREPTRPVPWPDTVKVADRRLAFPEWIGPYRLAGDGAGSGADPGQLNGRVILDRETLEILGIFDHDLNWYYSGCYRDTRTPRGPGARYLMLDLTYHTGELAHLPPMPEVAVFAGGGRIIAAECGPVPLALTSLPAGWGPQWRQVEIHRTVWEAKGPGRGRVHAAAYHLFVFNGAPTRERKDLRRRHVRCSGVRAYAATVKVGLLPPARTLVESDRLCGEFLQAVLPEVLRFLPSPAEVERLNNAR